MGSGFGRRRLAGQRRALVAPEVSVPPETGGKRAVRKTQCAETVLTVLILSSFQRVMPHVLIVSTSYCMRLWGAHHLHVLLHVIHSIHLRVALVCMMQCSVYFGRVGIRRIRLFRRRHRSMGTWLLCTWRNEGIEYEYSVRGMGVLLQESLLSYSRRQKECMVRRGQVACGFSAL